MTPFWQPDKNQPLNAEIISVRLNRKYPAIIVRVHCPYCFEEHGHGLPHGKLEGTEHRVADCDAHGSRKGYYLIDPNNLIGDDPWNQ